MRRIMKMPTLSRCMLGLILVSQLGCIGVFTDGLTPGSIPPALPDVEWINTEQSLPISLEALKGSPVLLEFWSSECGPCVQSIPKIERLKKAYQSKGLQVVSIHLTLGWDNHGSDLDAVKNLSRQLRSPIPWDSILRMNPANYINLSTFHMRSYLTMKALCAGAATSTPIA